MKDYTDFILGGMCVTGIVLAIIGGMHWLLDGSIPVRTTFFCGLALFIISIFLDKYWGEE